MHAIPRWLHMPTSPYVAHGPGDVYPPDMWCIVAIWGHTSGDVVTPRVASHDDVVGVHRSHDRCPLWSTL